MVQPYQLLRDPPMLRLRASIVFVLMTCGPATVLAADATYWVLGSFLREAGAVSERERLAGVLGEQVRIAMFERDGQPLYRVVVTATLTQDVLEAEGISPWAVRIGAARFDQAAAPAAMAPAPATHLPVAAATLAPAASDPLQSGVPIEPPPGVQPGETYASHCADTSQMLRDPLCESAEFRALQESRDRLERSQALLRRYCSLPDNADKAACNVVR